MDHKNILIAPVQGHTDAAWRHFHNAQYGGGFEYCTPFIRLEHDEIRPRDMKDAFGDLTHGVATVPQVIFRNGEELVSLVEKLKGEGASRIDINMGCPFPPQTSKGRGAATVGNPECREAVRRVVMETPGVSFSVKLRLGMSDPQEWRALLPVLNSLPLRHITMHPRVARQQYGGDVNLDEFRCLLAGSVNPVVYNGDIRTPRDAERIYEEFPEIFGIMLGRGVLGRPSLATEIASGEEWSPEKRIAEVKKFHRCLLSHYESILCGDHQTLSKILPFWEYAEEEIGRKAWKAIKKAVNMAKYNTGVAMIAGS